MTQKNDTTVIGVVHPVCCGIDVHKESISCCIISSDERGKEVSHIREFTTFTDDLFRLKEWLVRHHCPIVAMESTGVYWQPIHNVLEGCVTVILVNARDLKHVPGRKTDIGDSKWLGGLLRHGLVRGSFIPPKDVRAWRDLTRLRMKYVYSLGNYIRRTQKVFDSANIKISSVISDLFGVTGRNLMTLLVSRDRFTDDDIRGCLRGTVRGKADEIIRALHGFFTDHHRFLLRTLLATIRTLEETIASLDRKLEEMMNAQQDVLTRMKEVPGIAEISSRAILAEMGPTLAAFPTAASLASWSGVCPGNNESAGKRKSGRHPVRKHHVKTILTEAAWGAIRTKGSYYKDKYYRLKARKGSKKAIIAIAHRILKALFFIVKQGRHYHELGEEYLTRRNKGVKIIQLTREAERLGYRLVLTPQK